jgi:hypothetical protein
MVQMTIPENCRSLSYSPLAPCLLVSVMSVIKW